MDPLSKNATIARYCIVLVAMCAVAIGIRGLKFGSLFGFIVFALISLKYPLFDNFVRTARRRWPKLKVVPWLWIGYALAAAVDIGATWITMSDEGGASFALWVAVLITPCLLAAALACMIVHTQIAHKR